MHIASLFASIGIWWWVEKVQAMLSKWIVWLGYTFTHIVMEDKQPRYDYDGNVFSCEQKFIPWFWLRKIISLIRMAFRVKKYCNTQSVDVFIWQWDFFFMVTGLAKIFGNKSRTVAVVHTSLRMRPSVIRWFLLAFLRVHDHIVVISNDEFSYLVNTYHLPETKLSLIYNAIDLPIFCTAIENSVEPVYINKQIYTFLHIWRLSYQKWQERLVQAFQLLHTEFTDTQLLIIGDGPYKDTIQSYITTDSIKMLGKLDNIVPYLKYADCFVLSSRFEWFPMVLIEALAADLPSIAVDCPTWPSEIIQSNLLVPDDQYVIENLYKTMKKIYLDPSIYISSVGYSLLQQFDQNNNVTKWKKVLDTLMG